MAFAVFDPSGNVAAWLAAGRGVNVWRNANLSDPNVGGLAFTPADTEGAPHWKYGATPEAVSHDPADFTFYQRVGLAYCSQNGGHAPTIWPRTLFSETASGYKAACKAADRLEEASPAYDAPIGRVSHAYTIERLHMASEEKREDGRALATSSHFAVIEWSLIEEATPQEEAS